jgi:hypothetical protein
MPAEVVPINPKPATKPPALPDLVGQTVEVYLNHVAPGVKPRIAKLEHVAKGWLIISWIYRGRRHRAYLPTAGIQMVKTVERLSPRSRSASYS